MDVAIAPIGTAGLDPDARLVLEGGEEILIGLEGALALHEAEAAQVWSGKDLMAQAGGIIEGFPNCLAVGHLYHKSIGVMNFGAVIIRLVFGIFTEPEHA